VSRARDGLCDGDIGHESDVRRRMEAGSGMLSAERGSSKVDGWVTVVFGREMDGFVVDGSVRSGRAMLVRVRGGAALNAAWAPEMTAGLLAAS